MFYAIFDFSASLKDIDIKSFSIDFVIKFRTFSVDNITKLHL